MKFSAYLENQQPVLWNTILNSFKNKRVSHAYLLMGEKGMPLKESALFIAKSILCDNPSPLADEECRTCTRIDHLTYSDFIFLNGEEGTIKKEAVQNIIDTFSKTPLERKGLMVYVINLVENMSVESVNSLLKFLEEPTPNTYAILTTENEARILPTIISRAESIRLVLQPRENVISEALELEVSQEDAELLSFFNNSGDLVKLEAEDPSYKTMKGLFEKSLNALAESRGAAIFAFEKDIIPSVSKKEDAKEFIDYLTLALKDVIALKEKNPIKLASYAKLIEGLSLRLPHVQESLREVLKCRNELDLNMNAGLILEHIANYITKEF